MRVLWSVPVSKCEEPTPQDVTVFPKGARRPRSEQVANTPNSRGAIPQEPDSYCERRCLLMGVGSAQLHLPRCRCRGSAAGLYGRQTDDHRLEGVLGGHRYESWPLVAADGTEVNACPDGYDPSLWGDALFYAQCFLPRRDA